MLPTFYFEKYSMIRNSAGCFLFYVYIYNLDTKQMCLDNTDFMVDANLINSNSKYNISHSVCYYVLMCFA